MHTYYVPGLDSAIAAKRSIQYSFLTFSFLLFEKLSMHLSL